MSPEKQRIAIAEACGWKFYCVNALNEHVYHGPDGRVAAIEDLPDYLNDLNAMREAVLTLKTKTARELFQWHLGDALKDDYWKMVNATATQRAEAFLKTIGKWEDEDRPVIPAHPEKV